jgi:hypothetical protein
MLSNIHQIPSLRVDVTLQNEMHSILDEGTTKKIQAFNDKCMNGQPKLSVLLARRGSGSLPDFAVLIGAKMEPTYTNLTVPRFASIRHGFDVPAHLK